MDHLRPKAQPHHVPHLNNIVHAVIRSDQIDYQSLFSKVHKMSLTINVKIMVQ